MPTHHSHLGIYALIVNEAGQILAIRKARGPYTGLFDLPGGSPEDGELLEQTLTREVLEETGCTVTAHIQLGATSALYPREENGQPHLLRHIGILYRCQINGAPTQTGDGQDSHGTLWLTPTEQNLQNATPFLRHAAALIPPHN